MKKFNRSEVVTCSKCGWEGNIQYPQDKDNNLLFTPYWVEGHPPYEYDTGNLPYMALRCPFCSFETKRLPLDSEEDSDIAEGV